MNAPRLITSLLLAFAAMASIRAEEDWRPVLRQMPLRAEAGALARSNCLPALLAAFQSNQIVKALVVLPGVSDDFYLLNRAQPLHLRATNLAEAIAELEQTTSIRVSYRPPLLLLHTAKDKLKPEITSFNRMLAKRLREQSSAPHILLADRHWDTIQPWLAELLGSKVTPEPRSIDAWHFARHNLVAWQLADWDLLNALSLTGGTKIIVGREQLRFEQRGAPPKTLRFSQPASF